MEIYFARLQGAPENIRVTPENRVAKRQESLKIPASFWGSNRFWMIRSYQRGSLASKMAKNLGAMGLHHGFFEISDGPNPWFLYWMMMMDLKILFFFVLEICDE